MLWSKWWPTSKPPPSGCQLFNKTEMTHGLPHLPSGAGQPSPSKLQGGLGQNSPEVCHPFWYASGGALQSCAGALQVPHSHGGRRSSVWPLDAKHGQEEAQDSHFSIEGLITNIWVRGSCTPRQTSCGAHTMRTTATPLVHPLMGRWVWPTSPWGGWPAYDPVPRIPNGSFLIWHHGMDSLPLHSHRGDTLPMSVLDHCTNDPTADPIWIHGSIWILSTDWRTLEWMTLFLWPTSDYTILRLLESD